MRSSRQLGFMMGLVEKINTPAREVHPQIRQMKGHYVIYEGDEDGVVFILFTSTEKFKSGGPLTATKCSDVNLKGENKNQSVINLVLAESDVFKLVLVNQKMVKRFESLEFRKAVAEAVTARLESDPGFKSQSKPFLYIGLDENREVYYKHDDCLDKYSKFVSHVDKLFFDIVNDKEPILDTGLETKLKRPYQRHLSEYYSED